MLKCIIKKDLLSGFWRYRDWHYPNCLSPIGIGFLKVSGWDLSHLPGAQAFKA